MNKKRLPRKIKIVLAAVFLAFSAVVLSGIAVSTSALIQEKTQEVQQWTVDTHDGTNFPLIGKHRTVECRECHLNLVFEGTPSSCEACHWERRQDDRYRLRLGAHCADCHTPHAWKNVETNRWNHRAETGYRLEGIHRTLDCVDCHGESGFQSASADCFACHAEDYRQTREPDHESAGFPIQCQICHLNNRRWEDADFSHDFFVLRGQHLSANCSSCHLDGKFSGQSTDCFACHSTDFRETENPDHEQLGYPTDCVICHGTNSETWEGAALNHDAFVLSGQHLLADCLDCHADRVYAGRSSECVSCHLSDYQNTTEPDHQLLGFPSDCAVCHGTRAETWEGASFDHNPYLPLQGAHTRLDCSRCHSLGSDLPRECYGCHSEDYTSTDHPDHEVTGFPMDCELCHYPTHFFWSQAVFEHDFPIDTGKHGNRDCTECHLTSNFLEFSCTHCHVHDETNMRNEHDEVDGFLFNSLACYGCHPDGKE